MRSAWDGGMRQSEMNCRQDVTTRRRCSPICRTGHATTTDVDGDRTVAQSTCCAGQWADGAGGGTRADKRRGTEQGWTDNVGHGKLDRWFLAYHEWGTWCFRGVRCNFLSLALLFILEALLRQVFLLHLRYVLLRDLSLLSQALLRFASSFLLRC